MSKNSDQSSRPLSVSTKLLFSTGDISSSLPLAIQMFFQLYFLTDIARLSPAAAGWVLMLTRLWDAVNDPIVGLLSDRIRSRFGRRRVLLMYGSVPLGAFFALGWLIPPFNDFGLAVYYTIVLIAFDTAFTVVHVGFNSLTPEMTQDYDERSTLNGYRMAFSLGGTLAAISFATLLEGFTQSEVVRFAIIGVTLGTVAAIPPWIVCAVAKEPESKEEPPNLSLLKAIQATLTNRAFALLMLIYLASWTATCVLASMLVYYAKYYWQVPGNANLLVLIAEASAVIFVPVSVYLARTLDKPRAYLLGIGFWCLILLSIAALDRESVSIAYVLAFFCGPGIATALVIPWSMVPDVIEDDQQRTGARREGAFYSLVAFFQKLATGMALWAIGQALAINGYVTPTEQIPVPDQPESVLTAMRLIVGPASVILLALSLPVAWKYPISRQSHRELIGQLNTSSKQSPP